MKKIKIALVDDSPFDLQILRDAFQKSTHIDLCYTFMNGSDFLQYLSENTLDIDVAVIDYNMPILNGLETFKNLSINKVNFKLLLTSHAYHPQAMKELTKIDTQNYCMKTPETLQTALLRIMDNKNVYDSPSSLHAWETLSKTDALAAKDEFSWRTFLSPLEKKIIKLISLGWCSAEIGRMLGYQASSIEKYRGYILKNLGIKNAQQLSSWAITSGLVSLSFTKMAHFDVLSYLSVPMEELNLLRLVYKFQKDPSQFPLSKKNYSAKKK